MLKKKAMMATLINLRTANSIDPIQNVVSRISMRGMRFDYVRSFPTPFFVVSAQVPDADDENKLITRATSLEIAETSERGIVNRLHTVVGVQYAHEVDELFRYDGRAIFNPHKVRGKDGWVAP